MQNLGQSALFQKMKEGDLFATNQLLMGLYPKLLETTFLDVKDPEATSDITASVLIMDWFQSVFFENPEHLYYFTHITRRTKVHDWINNPALRKPDPADPKFKVGGLAPATFLGKPKTADMLNITQVPRAAITLAKTIFKQRYFHGSSDEELIATFDLSQQTLSFYLDTAHRCIAFILSI